jgi:chromosome segregation ATPase
MTLIGNYFNRQQGSGRQKGQKSQSDQPKEASAPPEENDRTIHFMQQAKNQDAKPEDQLASLMNAVKDQAINLKCEQAKVISDWQIGLDLLARRMATLQPLLTKSLQTNAEKDQTIERLSSAEAELTHRLLEAERDLAHYRPLAIQLDDDLRAVRVQLKDSHRHVAELEAEYAKSQGTINDLFQKAATADAARQRVLEENASYAQKLNEQDASLQSLVRQTAQLKSELVSSGSDVERLETELRSVTKKLASECDEHARAKAAMETAESQLAQLQKESLAQIKEAEARERRATEALSVRDKQYYDLDIRQSALLSKVDFLSRTNQRQREDLRRHLDHIGNLEASNRQLLDALARNAAGDDPAQEVAGAPSPQPLLRAVPVDEAS